VRKDEIAMPRPAVEGNSRVTLRIRPAGKALILRAVALAQTDMTEFIIRTALKEAQSVIDQHERVKLIPGCSQGGRRDDLGVLQPLPSLT
jgi:uncharacterized protein (DUF1778 family)